MTPDLQRALAHYVEGGWVDASFHAYHGHERQKLSAYLVLVSGMAVWPGGEVQVTARCGRPFRAHKMIVAEDSSRFDIVDLAVGNLSQFTRAEDIPLRSYVGLVCGRREEVRPEPIRWPLEVCTLSMDMIVRATNRGSEEAEFEVVLLGEVV